MPTPATLALSFSDMLALIEDRSAALRSATLAAGLTARVPGCPDWSVRELVEHLGEVQLFWAAAVAAGPADGPPGGDVTGDLKPRGDLMTWSADASAALTGALREAGADRGCWTWWGASGAPQTAGAVARHQVQEAGVHAYDAQEAAGRAEPLPPAVAADGVGEFLTVGLASMGPWPHDPATVLFAAGPGGSWQLELGPAGGHAQALAGPDTPSPRRALTVTADPGDLVLFFYRRKKPDGLQVTGDLAALQRLQDWPDMD